MSIVTVSNNKKKKKIEWLDLYNPTPEDRLVIEDRFDFLEGDVDDAFGRTYRSKIVKRDKYIFLSLLLPLKQKTTDAFIISEIDILLSPKTLITIHQHRLAPLNELLDDFDKHTNAQNQMLDPSIEVLLREVLQQVLEYTYPLVDAVTEEMEKLHDTIFSGKYTRKTIEDILQIKQTIIEMRGAMRGHAEVLHTLIKPDPYHTGNILINPELFEPLIDDAAENWAQLESLKEMIETLEDANESFLSHDLNDTMKMLTAFSVVLLPASVVAGIFGMNAISMPFIEHTFGFWIMTGIVMLSSLSILLLFWKKRWLK